MSRVFDVLVVGGGVCGLACGAALARAGRRVLLVERRPGLAQETSSRNSQVIHAGLYYAPGSQKATLCVRGRELLYARCRERRIAHRALGKLVVAVEAEQEAALEALCERGRANGAPGLELVSGAEVSRREPAVRARLGLWSPRTGIVDAHAFALSYAAELEAAGGTLLLDTELLELARGAGWRATLRVGDGPPEELETEAVVNAAGLASDTVAALAGLSVDALGYRQRPCKGDYFALAPGAPLRFRHLVYPLHERVGLGIHVTLDLGGRVRLGPDATWVDAPSYEVDASKAALFARSAGRYLPGLRAEWLTPDQAGIRPRLAGPGEAPRDFVVEEASAHGAPGLVNLIGIESPGLTAAAAIAERVVALLS